MMAAADPCSIRAAEQMLAGRRARDAVFGADRDGFGEPGWDMLLALFAAQRAMSRAEALAAGAAQIPAAAERYLEWLLSRDLVQSENDHIIISDRGSALMIACLGR